MYHGERFNSFTHLAGAALATAGCVALVVSAGAGGDPWKIVGFAIFGAMLVALYTISALYHSLRGRPKLVLRKLDHCAIYLLIAGTYSRSRWSACVAPRVRRCSASSGASRLLGIVQDSGSRAARARSRSRCTWAWDGLGWSRSRLCCARSHPTASLARGRRCDLTLGRGLLPVRRTLAPRARNLASLRAGGQRRAPSSRSTSSSLDRARPARAALRRDRYHPYNAHTRSMTNR